MAIRINQHVTEAHVRGGVSPQDLFEPVETASSHARLHWPPARVRGNYREDLFRMYNGLLMFTIYTVQKGPAVRCERALARTWRAASCSAASTLCKNSCLPR